MHPTEADSREALDLARATFAAAKANCESLEAAVDDAYEKQTAAECEYTRLSKQSKAAVREAVLAFVDGDDREPAFESPAEFAEADAELDRCISNVTTFESDLHRAILAKSAASETLDRACLDVVKAHVASETARAKELEAQLQGILPLLAAADGTEYAENDAERTKLLRRYANQLPAYSEKSSLWLWREALKADSNATLEL
jgi:hypothetical protein